MTAVAVERPGRTKLEQAEKALHALVEERDALVEDIARLTELEEQAIRDSARSAPTARIFKLGSPAQRAREKLEKAQKRLPLLDREIAAKHEAIGEMRARWAREEAEKYVREADRLRGLEVEAYRACGETFAELLERWHSVLDVVEAIDRLLDQAGPVLDHLTPDDREAFARVLLPQIRPVPAGFLRFLEVLTEACLDHRGLGIGPEGMASQEAKLLAAAGVPFLKGQDRKLSASGRVPRSGTQPQMPARVL